MKDQFATYLPTHHNTHKEKVMWIQSAFMPRVGFEVTIPVQKTKIG